MQTLPTFSTPEEAFTHFLKGHQDAIAFAILICGVLHLWDDLEDRDHKITRKEIDDAFYQALIVIPRNVFYREHFAELNTALDLAILNWHAANELERNGQAGDDHIAFIIRSEYCNLLILAARIVGGYAWACSVAPMIRRFWHKEGFEGYKQNLEAQFRNEKEIGHVL